jgi:hypothetical protein
MEQILLVGQVKNGKRFYDVGDSVLINSMKRHRPNDLFYTLDLADILSTSFNQNVFDMNKSTFKKLPINYFSSIVFLETSHLARGIHQRPNVQNFLEFLNVHYDGKSLNPIKSFFKCEDKFYLIRPGAEKFFPKTLIINKNEKNLESLMKTTFFSNELVMKPIIGFGGIGVTKTSIKDYAVFENDFQSMPEGDIILQEFVPAITSGERSLFFFDKKFEYGVLKVPKQGEFRSNLSYAQNVQPYVPTKKELELAQDALSWWDSGAKLERVDMTSEKLIELTAECPGLYVYDKVNNHFFDMHMRTKIGKLFYQLLDNYYK